MDLLSILLLIIMVIIIALIVISITMQNNENISNTNQEREKVIENSLKIQKIKEINMRYLFKNIMCRNHKIIEREYSRKSLDRSSTEDVIKYYIENDINGLRTDIENAIYNISLLEKYNEETNKAFLLVTENTTELQYDEFKEIENITFQKYRISENIFYVSANVEIYYESNGKRVFDNKISNFSFDDLKAFYSDWKKGNKYKTTMKQERRIMNDDIRYNVLKRDNYACQICGASAKDGIKLHVDHIKPVSEGGKTVMSNLQTLCERCNKGKSNKTEKDFKENLICPECGGKLIERKGKYGKFYGCSNYPKCHFMKKI